ncbi:MAG TPA: DUF4148 domain-containing protein [Paraburkholderia sp.]|uniref:DUF4148 domain-containing protein n=1 Tax=Paraburkholderia sp. TaxID=1926495 RepID=UPI002ED42B6A
MKRLFLTSIIAIAAIVPAASFAQTANGPLTRADVRAQSAQAAQDHRMSSKVHYPDWQQSARPGESVDTGGYGMQSGGSSESRVMPGHTMSSSAKAELFAHH